MNPQRKKRIVMVVFIVFGVSLAAGLALSALKQNINLYYTPTQLAAAGYPKERNLRMGGMVEKGSLHYAAKGLQVNFILTDFVHTVPIQYSGVLPVLFREGQGVVVDGKLIADGTFIASQILAKHDATYMPPGVKDK